MEGMKLFASIFDAASVKVALGLYEFSAKFRVTEKKNRSKLGRTNRPPKFLY